MVLGCNSRCGHRVLLESVPDLNMNFKDMFFCGFFPHPENVEKSTFFQPIPNRKQWVDNSLTRLKRAPTIASSLWIFLV